ncbi:hypothetical protein BDBG_01498 [Blastomyces gilchristii SLH14081]|uniref:Uncharacterized protein n=1 Tax=Blastomyces gilchristii (strain SLH14081) TaxID=559298 RepID=A0A179UAJ7_BLAGS|nr:uncharacterized protein BDBG_01498 [Blastomyces gilchristii SLH14081]OAT05045.1 hypothetical protein BDBG_01498 [Blastomyces gilchristii SLH14081]
MDQASGSDDRMTYLPLFASYFAGSGFNPCFWLPHQRMYLRATTASQRRLVHSHMVRYIRHYHDRSDMVDLTYKLVPAIASNGERDHLLSELYHIHPELWYLFERELQRLEEIEHDSTFDLDGWLDDLRHYPTIEERMEPSQLYSFFRYLDTQDRLSSVYYAIDREPDDDTVKIHLQNANRALQNGNHFHPNFWLPHRRMFQRATSDVDRWRVISHMISYVKTYHSGNHLMSTLQRSYEQQYNPVSRSDRANRTTPTNPLPASYPREEWGTDNGTADEVEIAGYRKYGSGYQVLLKSPAPRGGFFDYKLVPAHLLGGEAVIIGYTRRMEERGMAPFQFEEASIDLLRSKSKSQIHIAGRCVHRKQARAGGTVLQQYLMLTFTNEDGVYWYSKGAVEHYHNRVWVENNLLPGLFDASGLTAPGDIRRLNYRPQTSYTEETIRKLSDLERRAVSIENILREFFLQL